MLKAEVEGMSSAAVEGTLRAEVEGMLRAAAEGTLRAEVDTKVADDDGKGFLFSGLITDRLSLIGHQSFN